MQTIPISQAKARLSAILRRVQAGQEVVITDRGTPVARLVPFLPGGGGAAARLLATGVLAPARRPATARFVRELPAPPPAPSGVSLLNELLAEREEER